MQIHDLRCYILEESDNHIIKNSFPLKLGEVELDVGISYHINCKH